MRITKDIPYGPSGMMLDFYAPDQDGFDTLIWFHGGGFEAGSRRDAEPLAESVTALGLGFASVEYRMFPHAKFPDFLLDAAWAVAFLQKHGQDYGCDGRFVISGQSAGAYITMMLALNGALLRNAHADETSILAYVSESSQQTTHYNMLRQRGIDSRAERIDEEAPLYYVGQRPLQKPLLLIYNAQDIPCRPEQNLLMYQSIRHFQPEAPVFLKELPGGHCAGSTQKDENGQYPYVTALKEFLESLR